MKLISESQFALLVNTFKEIDPILVVGDIGLDKYTLGEVRRISPEAPVPILEVLEENLKLGMAANISNNLKTLNIDSTLCGIIGDDRFGDDFIGLMQEKNLTPRGLIRVGNRPTTYKERVTTNVQQICRVDYECKDLIDCSVEEKVVEFVKQNVEEHGAVILEDYGKGFFTESLTSRVIDECNKKNILISIDPSRITPPEFYKNATLLKPNLLEAQMMARSMGCRSDDLIIICETLVKKLNLKKLVITLGADGMCLLDTEDDGEIKKVPTLANEVYDVSGAGDTSISVITAVLASKGTLNEAVWLGNCASGVVVGKMGTATVSTDELIQHFNRIKARFVH